MVPGIFANRINAHTAVGSAKNDSYDLYVNENGASIRT